MDKVELVEQNKTVSKLELKIPVSTFLSILKEKFPEQLKDISLTRAEFSFENDLNSEEYLSINWTIEKSTDRSTEIKI